MKRGILYVVLCISPVMGLDLWLVSGTEKYCKKSRLYNVMKEKCDYEAQSVIFNDMEPFVNGVYGDKCWRQLLTFADALHKSSLWAVQMFDASAKTIEGRYQFGHFDECIDTNTGNDVDNIRGKYCLTDIKSGERETRIGVCIPNECGEREIQGILRTFYKQIPGDIEITGSACTTSEIPSQNTPATFLRYAIIALLSWTVFITAVDLITPESGKLNLFWGKATEIFSCYRNLCNLTDVKDEAEFSGVHFLKVATISLIIFCRRYQTLKESPIKNPTYFEQEGFISINQVSDLLIFQSGFLAVQKLSACGDISTKRCLTLCAARMLRLIPLYVAVIAFYASVLEGSGKGPVWVEKIENEARRCREFWWANLSFINNYIPSSRQCIAQSWYLAVTAHCSLLTLIFIHLKTRKSFVGLGSFAVILSTAVFLFVWNDLSLVKNRINHREYIIDSYIKTHNRVPAYAIGGASAFLCNYVKKSKDMTPRSKILLITFAFGVCGLISIISSSISEAPNTESILLQSITKSLLWSIFIACIYITSSICNLRSIHNVTKNLFVPLSRLSYSTILVYNVIQVYTTASMRMPEYVTFPRLIMMASSDIFASYTVAFVLYLIIEGPTKSWINMALGNTEQRNSVKVFRKEENDMSKYKPSH